jgi:glyoxylase-like metal-dependent hydrolase (beta-lactamase superfamily II)
MLVKCLPVGQLETNCYIVTNEKTLECVVIDPGDESNTIMDYLEDNSLSCRAILLTHAHWDHTGALIPVMEQTGAPVYLNRLDTAAAPAGTAGPGFQAPAGVHYYEKDGQILHLAGLDFTVLYTPGHTPGGTTLVCEDAIFCGDTLFRGSCGRTDLPGGDMMQELRSLKRLCELPGEYDVYPGHMDASTLERERNFNYYCRQAMHMN